MSTDFTQSDESELDILVVLLDGVNLQDIKINLRHVVENFDVPYMDIYVTTYVHVSQQFPGCTLILFRSISNDVFLCMQVA